MSAADVLCAAIERLHPIDRERTSARMLEFADTGDLLSELGGRYLDEDQERDQIVLWCKLIVEHDEEENARQQWAFAMLVLKLYWNEAKAVPR